MLFGYQVPDILRLVDDRYIFIGDCFVYGLMDGEALQGLTDGKAVVKSSLFIKNLRTRGRALVPKGDHAAVPHQGF